MSHSTLVISLHNAGAAELLDNSAAHGLNRKYEIHMPAGRVTSLTAWCVAADLPLNTVLWHIRHWPAGTYYHWWIWLVAYLTAARRARAARNPVNGHVPAALRHRVRVFESKLRTAGAWPA